MTNSELLVNLRTCTSGDDALERLATGQLIQLSATQAFPRDVWDTLPSYEQSRLTVIAHGRATSKAVLVGRSAARALGMWTVPLGPETTELALPSGHARSDKNLAADVTYRRMLLRPTDITTVDGVRVTNPLRTFTDIARFHGFKEGLVAADWLLSHNHSLRDLNRALVRLGRVKNIATVRSCIESASDRSESPGEALAKALFFEAGYRGIQQYRVGQFRADLFVEGVLIEIDGRVKYRKDPESALTSERQSENHIRNAGYVLVRFTLHDLIERPDYVLDTLERNIALARQLAATRV